MTSEDAVPAPDKREQPFLYSWNRRIRHLHGISLRNISITPPTSRSRGRTITEDDAGLKSSVKGLVSEERRALHHSKSFDTSTSSEIAPKSRKLDGTTEHAGNLKRPKAGRRRSTLHWASATPVFRQEKLEDATLDRLVDSWFSIHHQDQEPPIYVSEPMEKSMNPSFSFFDLDQVAASVRRSDSFKIKLWAKNDFMQTYTLLLDLTVNLRSLQFIGKTLENFHHPLPENCVLFHLSDGVYTSFTDMPAEDITEPHLHRVQESSSQASTSYDALMKLVNLDDCIQDALCTRQRLESDINAILKSNKQNTKAVQEKVMLQEKTRMIGSALSAERKHLEQLKRKKVEMERSRALRLSAMTRAKAVQTEVEGIPVKIRKEIEKIRSENSKLEETSMGQVRRICEDLLRIYPIDPIKSRTLQFTIRSIHLPNSVFDDTNRDEISAALGYASELTHHLALYLSIPLPYPIEPNGSGSFINDPISVSITQRKFPLHPMNVNYKFEYGVFLFNKDIEFLMNRSGLRVLDVRHTLPNLKYLLYVLTSGSGELPTRKAGGIRGLWGNAISPTLSRRGSEDSVTSRSSVDGPNSGIGLGKEKNTNGFENPAALGRVKGLPYRKSLLRDSG